METEICPTLEARAGTGGNNVPIIVTEMKEVIGFDAYNQNLTGGVSMTLRSNKADNEHIPCVIIGGGVESGREDGADIHKRRDG